jgi:hypothetical protein
MCYLSKYLQNTSHFVTLFTAHGDIVVGFAIFHIVLFQKKKALLHGLWKLVGTRWNRLAMVCERKSGEECQALKKSTKVPISLKTCLVWKIVRTPLPVIDKNNHLSKQNFLSILQMKSSSTCLNHCFPPRRAFLLLLCWVFTFYLYAPSERA